MAIDDIFYLNVVIRGIQNLLCKKCQQNKIILNMALSNVQISVL